MKKIVNFLFSGTFMGMLLIVFAVSLGYATFIENDFTAETARILVYNSIWFEVLIGIMAVNFIGMIFTKKLYRIGKRNVMMIHIAWVVIIIGAALTHFFGYEGTMHIRDGETSDQMTSSSDFVVARLSDQGHKFNVNDKIQLAPIDKKYYSRSIRWDNNDIELSIVSYLPNASMSIVDDPEGGPVLQIVTAGPLGRQDLFVSTQDTNSANGLNFTFNDSTASNSIQFKMDSNKLLMKSPYPVLKISMNKGDSSAIPANTFIPASTMQVYSVQGVLFLIHQFIAKGSIEYNPSNDNESSDETQIVYFSATVNGDQKVFPLKWQEPTTINLKGVNLVISVGPREIKLPFSLTLNQFNLTRYPGSNSPSSFSSDIVLVDSVNHVKMPYKIFMNNVLKYRGYRFYQSSYDRDEHGTILSVNHDHWGTLVTYIGYALLFYTLFVSLFMKNARFAKLSRLISELHEQRKKLVVAIAFLVLSVAVASPAGARTRPDVPVIDKKEAALFGQMLIQSSDGRIEPVNTIANNILVKIYKKTSYEGMNAVQVFMGMGIFTNYWEKMPIIKVSDESLKSRLNIKGDYATYEQFFENKDKYILKDDVNRVYQKSPATRTADDRELLAVDERVNVCRMVFTGEMLRIYPFPGNANNKWVNVGAILDWFKSMDPLFGKASFIKYVQEIHSAVHTHDYSQADEILHAIREIQEKYSASIIPSNFKIHLEIFYNKINVFKNLFPVYMMLGLILLGIFLLQLFKPSVKLNALTTILYRLLLILFIIHTAGLIMRWIIAEHAPWSNGYESMIYIAWAIVLAGILFRTKSTITLAITSILAGITLLTAHMSWLNPEITNLVPVLKSYWLTIHVATITASYGFLALGSMLGFLNLVLMIARTKNNIQRVGLTINEISYVIEMNLSVGLVLLTIGTFLGGIWANESWGRYWGWDPKETWSLITIIVYSFILHMNLIPSFKTQFTLNFFALVGFASVLMTYFGVNYFLSGLHSYAEGAAAKVPSSVYYAVGIVIILGILAAISEARFQNQKMT